MTERFTLLSELGRGGMGVVWKARDEETGQTVALKLLREMYAEDPDYLERFERELELARRIDSAHVVKVLGFGVRKKVPYLALEFVDGPSLHDALAKHGPYGWAEARALIVQIAQGLADAHSAGVIHRDVKPSNVLIGPDGTAKLTDFGIARGLDLERMTATSTMLGTPAYLAPEGPKDARSDLYSLGIIGYQLLAGSPPFVGQTYQEVLLAHLRDAPDLTRLPSEVRPIIGWLLAKDPAQRPRNAWEAMPVVEGRLFLAKPDADVSRAAAVSVVSGTSRPAGRPPASVRAPERRSNIRTSKADDRSNAGPWTLVSQEITGAQLRGGRLGHTATALPNDRVLLAGGRDSDRALASAQVFQPLAGTFGRVSPMKSARLDHAATCLADGRVLVCGGKNGGAIASAEVYDRRISAFLPTGSMTTRRQLHTATLLPRGVVLVTGGWDGRRSLASAEVYDPASGRFYQIGAMFSPRESHTATLLRDGTVLFAGGDNDGRPSDTADVSDPEGTFRRIGPMRTARTGHTATLLPDGTVLVVGGEDIDGNAINSAECFDPHTGTFRPASAMRLPRAGHAATLTPDGLVLVVGGANDAGVLVSVEAYDPATGRFADVGRLKTARLNHTATVLADCRVLVAGGENDELLDSIELLTLEHAL
jgi:Protein kinase domain/Galactose oxidase, central domain/Kelch motif